MSLAEPEDVARALAVLHDASRSIGCELSEPFLQLAFLSLPVIPTLKLTDVGASLSTLAQAGRAMHGVPAAGGK